VVGTWIPLHHEFRNGGCCEPPRSHARAAHQEVRRPDRRCRPDTL
jgi:hypothetical protein